MPVFAYECPRGLVPRMQIVCSCHRACWNARRLGFTSNGRAYLASLFSHARKSKSIPNEEKDGGDGMKEHQHTKESGEDILLSLMELVAYNKPSKPNETKQGEPWERWDNDL